jgi:hypothetical protein
MWVNVVYIKSEGLWRVLEGYIYRMRYEFEHYQSQLSHPSIWNALFQRARTHSAPPHQVAAFWAPEAQSCKFERAFEFDDLHVFWGATKQALATDNLRAKCYYF